MSENPITAWVDSIPDLPTDPTRRAMVIALETVEEEIEQRKLEAQAFGFDCIDELGCFQRLSAARIALTDALFPPDGVAPARAENPNLVRALSVAFRAIDRELGRDVRIALIDMLFPETVGATTRAPVPEWFIADMREKQRICSGALRRLSGTLAGDRAQAQHQLLDELLQQATEVRSC